MEDLCSANMLIFNIYSPVIFARAVVYIYILRVGCAARGWKEQIELVYRNFSREQQDVYIINVHSVYVQGDHCCHIYEIINKLWKVVSVSGPSIGPTEGRFGIGDIPLICNVPADSDEGK